MYEVSNCSTSLPTLGFCQCFSKSTDWGIIYLNKMYTLKCTIQIFLTNIHTEVITIPFNMNNISITRQVPSGDYALSISKPIPSTSNQYLWIHFYWFRWGRDRNRETLIMWKNHWSAAASTPRSGDPDWHQGMCPDHQ